LRAISLGAQALENFAPSHVEKLNVNFRMLLFVARHEVAQHFLAVWRVDKECVVRSIRRSTRERSDNGDG
jgi:hypothetical protein